MRVYTKLIRMRLIRSAKPAARHRKSHSRGFPRKIQYFSGLALGRADALTSLLARDDSIFPQTKAVGGPDRQLNARAGAIAKREKSVSAAGIEP